MRILPRLLACVLVCTLPSGALSADRYEFDKSHTSILFFISHLGLSNMIGKFTHYDGYFLFDPKRPAQGSVHAIIYPASVETSSEALDTKLQGKDFFNSERFPTITFDSTSVKKTGKNKGKVQGNLTLLGITKPVTLDVVFNKAATHPYTKDYVAGFTAKALLKRSDFGMVTGLPDVGDDVQIHIETEGVKRVSNPHRKKR